LAVFFDASNFGGRSSANVNKLLSEAFAKNENQPSHLTEYVKQILNNEQEQVGCDMCAMPGVAHAFDHARLTQHNVYAKVGARLDADMAHWLDDRTNNEEDEDADDDREDLYQQRVAHNSQPAFTVDKTLVDAYSYLKYVRVANGPVNMEKLSNRAETWPLDRSLCELYLTRNFIRNIPPAIFELRALHTFVLKRQPLARFTPAVDKFVNIASLRTLEIHEAKFFYDKKEQPVSTSHHLVELPASLTRLALLNWFLLFI
jgi:hypothetical protein